MMIARRFRPELRAPLHPLFVHFTVALSTISFLVDAVQWIGGGVADLGWWLMAGAVLTTVFTVWSGIASRLRLAVEAGDPACSFLRVHMALGPIVFGLIVISAIWRASLWQGGRGISPAYLAECAVAVLAVAVQGYLGGEMVYRFGLGVKGGFRALPIGAAPGRLNVRPARAGVADDRVDQ